MTIKQQGGIFGRNPTFNDVTVDDTLTAASQIKTPILVNGVASGTLTIGAGAAQNTGANILMYGESHPQVSDFLFRAGTTGLVRIEDSGVVKILNGNLKFDTAGTGIDFSATSGTGTSELFDDYEEGTWTPSIGGDATYLAQVGTYTKVGNQVHIFCYIQPDVIGTGSPNAISGIPFACADAASSLSVGLWSSYPSAAISVTANVQGSLIYVAGKATATTSSGGINPFTVDGGARLRLSGTYRTS